MSKYLDSNGLLYLWGKLKGLLGGKVDKAEVDFVAVKSGEKLYVQVTESMMSEDVRRRELAPLQKISDNYEKLVLSLEPGLQPSYDGIWSLELTSWLTGDV